jgi:hypothetical protein
VPCLVPRPRHWSSLHAYPQQVSWTILHGAGLAHSRTKTAAAIPAPADHPTAPSGQWAGGRVCASWPRAGSSSSGEGRVRVEGSWSHCRWTARRAGPSFLFRGRNVGAGVGETILGVVVAAAAAAAAVVTNDGGRAGYLPWCLLQRSGHRAPEKIQTLSAVVVRTFFSGMQVLFEIRGNKGSEMRTNKEESMLSDACGNRCRPSPLVAHLYQLGCLLTLHRGSHLSGQANSHAMHVPTGDWMQKSDHVCFADLAATHRWPPLPSGCMRPPTQTARLQFSSRVLVRA